jgi:RNA polymerase sigma-70 factor, ECF subfamily
MKGLPRQEGDLPTEPPGPEQEHSDESLLRRFRSGDEDAAARLYHRYAHRLRAVVKARTSAALAARLDAEDIVQSVFRSFFRCAVGDVYQVPDGGDLWKLLLTIALNKVRAQGIFHHAAKRDVDATRSLSAQNSDLAIQSREDSENIELQMALDDALARLPEAQRAMVELRLHGHEVEAIARQLGRSKRTVERNLQRALSQLSALFEND